MLNSNAHENEQKTVAPEVVARTESRDWSSKNELSALIIDFRNKTISNDEFYRKVYPLIRLFCRYVKNHSKSNYFTNEIMDHVVQNVMIGFYKYIAEKVDLDENFIGYLYRTVLREVYQHNKESHVIKTSGQKDKNGKTIHFAKVDSIDFSVDAEGGGSTDGMLGINAHEFAEYDSLNEDSESHIGHGLSHHEISLDKNKALNKLRILIEEKQNCLYHLNNKSYKQMKDNFNMTNASFATSSSDKDLINSIKLKPIGVGGVSQNFATESKPEGAAVKRKNKVNLNKETMSPEKRILTEIRENLCLSVEDFAQAVGVSTYVMSSYLYRVDVQPKDWVVTAAKALQGDNSETFNKIKKLKKLYGNKKMSEILHDWSVKLGFDLNSTKVVAAIFNTTPTTILRWKNNNNKPSLLMLNTYYEIALLNIRSGEVALTETKSKSKTKPKTKETVVA